MAYKFYHRYTVAEFQRYRDFFPKHAKVPAIRTQRAIEVSGSQGTPQGAPQLSKIKDEPDSTTSSDLSASSGVLRATATDDDLPVTIFDEGSTGGSVNDSEKQTDKHCTVSNAIPRLSYAPTFYRGSSFAWSYHHLHIKPCTTPSPSSSRMSSASPPSSSSRSFDDTLSMTSVLASLPQTSSSSSSQSLQLAASTSSLSSVSSISSSSSTRSNRRKASRPRRSVKRNDPKFRGVTFTVGTTTRRNIPLIARSKIYIRSHFSLRRFKCLLAGRLTSRRWRRLSSSDCSAAAGDETPSDVSDDHDDTPVTSRASQTSPNPSTTAYYACGGTRRRASSKVPTYLGFPSAKTKPVYKNKRRRPTSTDSSKGKLNAPHRHSSRTSSAYRCALSSASGPSGMTEKQCRSCETTRTPLWRDAEDGTPLCNACGIRYKKYRIRCPLCWLIPRKDSKTFPHCGHCGALVDTPQTRPTEEM